MSPTNPTAWMAWRDAHTLIRSLKAMKQYKPERLRDPEVVAALREARREFDELMDIAEEK